MTGGSESFLRAKEAAVGLPKVGGGDFNRGEMGHRGASRVVSLMADDKDKNDFWGTGARTATPV